MTEQRTLKNVQLISEQSLKKIDHEIKKYPVEQKQSAVMAALRIVQEQEGYLTTELMNAIADYLDMPAIAVYEVATFYTMYEHEPVGKHVIHVCRSISCHLRGADDLVKCLENKLSTECGGTTSDGQYTLKSAECLGACVHAPVVQVNKTYHENVTKQQIDELLEQYK
jgi:NADH-quinone oxidoreductase subunit E